MNFGSRIMLRWILLLWISAHIALLAMDVKAADISVEMKSALQAYPDTAESKSFVEDNRQAVIDVLHQMLHQMLHTSDATKVIDRERQMDLILLLDPKSAESLLIYVAKFDEDFRVQVKAINKLPKYGSGESLSFLYTCLQPNDMRVLAAMQAIRQFKETEYAYVLRLLERKPDEYQQNIDGEELRSHGFNKVQSTGIQTLAWSADKECLVALEKISNEDAESIRAIFSKEALFLLQVWFDAERDDKLRALLKYKAYAPWVRGMVQREGVVGILSEE